MIVTHSQGGLILQRHVAWMVHEGRARELARIRAIVLLACPNEGSEYLGTIRRALGFGRHPQAGQLATLVADATEARRTFLRSVVNAQTLSDRECPIPVHAYAGRTTTWSPALRRRASSLTSARCRSPICAPWLYRRST
ncbi:hypothetical protein AB0K00_14750 [Dactylosporangium sp. NPDC049525]|uniref:hypothetical protein n=1 Tax=Dactylosporangium sp. NPDC049525 TaxID=3154730 RepID=UPI00342DF17E